MEARWLIDHASLLRHPNPMAVLAHLLKVTSRPGWDRDRLCRDCENWKPIQGEDTKPERPGAINPAGESGGCAGCWYAMLEANPNWKRPARTQRKGYVPLPVVETAMVEVEPGKSLTIEWTEAAEPVPSPTFAPSEKPIWQSGPSPYYAKRRQAFLPHDKHDDPADRRVRVDWV